MSAFIPNNAGFRTGCVSSWGAFDMVGNVWEWIGDWGGASMNGCSSWSAGFGGDLACIGGDGGSFGAYPGAVFRGGDWLSDTSAGVFAAVGSLPYAAEDNIGFRCAR